MSSKNVILYRRVSTREQGRSGLGLESQRADLMTYCERQGYVVLADYCEVASGGGVDLSARPVLAEALDKARRTGATVLVAKLDRLSRAVGLIDALMRDPTISFEVAEIGPKASPLELHLRASFSEEERRRISERTKAALAAKRRRGEPLGNLVNLDRGAHRGHEARRAAALRAAEAHREMFELVASLSHREAAKKLNRMGWRTTSGEGQWHAASVARLRARLAAMSKPTRRAG